MTKTYVVPKVDDAGEDVKVPAQKFDVVLKKMLNNPPETNSALVAKRRARKGRTEGKSNSR